ncbi:hypothetical protein C8Q75DRAFT_478037 [Abortiporus biennis]|nr:hypothetical protein C8Q75DRAFT_478037 [Abortiporus biennis]
MRISNSRHLARFVQEQRRYQAANVKFRNLQIVCRHYFEGSYSMAWISAIPFKLLSVDNLEHLVLEKVDFTRTNTKFITAISFFRGMKTLRLSKVMFSSFNGFVRLLRPLKHLSRLDLIANEYPSHYKTPSSITAGIRSPLEHLALLQTTGPEREKFATSMLKAYIIHPNVHLRSLHIDDRLLEAKRFDLAKTLFDTCANTLEDLEIAHWGWTEVENIRAIFQPQRFKSLKSASFFCRCNWDALRSAPHIFTIIKSLNRTNVEHFNLSFVIGIKEWDLKFPLRELDTIMHECSFPSLVDFGIYICISKIRLERLFEEVKKQLPLMLASGIIVKPMGSGLNRYK